MKSSTQEFKNVVKEALKIPQNHLHFFHTQLLNRRKYKFREISPTACLVVCICMRNEIIYFYGNELAQSRKLNVIISSLKHRKWKCIVKKNIQLISAAASIVFELESIFPQITSNAYYYILPPCGIRQCLSLFSIL